MTPAEFREIRLRQGLTQSELMPLIGIAQQHTISRYETGASPLPKSVSKMMLIIDVLGVERVREILK